MNGKISVKGKVVIGWGNAYIIQPTIPLVLKEKGKKQPKYPRVNKTKPYMDIVLNIYSRTKITLKTLFGQEMKK